MSVERVREGEEPSAVIASYGFCRTTIYKWLNELLQERIEADLINIQNNRALVRSFFKAPDVAYIAGG